MAINLRQPTIPITEIEQSAFCQTDDTLKAKTLEEEFEAGVRWQKIPIPLEYRISLELGT